MRALITIAHFAVMYIWFATANTSFAFIPYRNLLLE